MSAPGESEYQRYITPPSSNVRNDIREFMDLSPRKQQEISEEERRYYAERMKEKHPLTQKTYAHLEEHVEEQPVPQNVRPITEKPSTFVPEAEDRDLRRSEYANTADVERPPHGTRAAPAEDDSIRGKLRTDTFGMADTLNSGEEEVLARRHAF